MAQASRTFSRERDLWIADHKPFKFLKYPLISAIMALETFLEASRLLYPYLQVLGARQVEFIEAIEVPEYVAIEATITTRRLRESAKDMGCEVVMETPLLSPTGKVLERRALNYRAQVRLGGSDTPSWLDLPGFPVSLEDLDTRPAELEEISGWY